MEVTVELTTFELTVTVADVAPAGTITGEETTTFEFVEVRFTARPEAGAGPLIVIVPPTGFPPTVALRDSVKPVSLGGVIDKTAD